MRHYKRIDSQGKITTVEGYSHNLKIKGAVEISKAEFDNYLASLPVSIKQPKRDYAIEIDNLKTRVANLEKA